MSSTRLGAGPRTSGDAAPALPAPAPPLTRREIAGAIGICALFATLWLAPAIFTGRVLSPADWLFDYLPWAAQRPPGFSGAANGLLSDSVAQFEPWLSFAAGRLRQGALPLWNPDNYLGAPFIANMQSAVFFPLNWLAFLWPDPALLVVRPWAKLVIAALGMYVLARDTLRLRPLAAAVAALPLVGGSFMTVWLFHAQTATAIWLPWLWWATARLLDRPDARRAAILALLVALHLFAGHPETAFHMAEATGLFALFRIGQTGPLRVGRVARLLGVWLAAYALGAAVAAIQLLPFLEYSAQSMSMLRRVERQLTPWSVPVRFAWTALSPDLFGNQVDRTWWADLSYTGTNNFSGALPLLLAPLAFLARSRARLAWAAFLTALLVLALAVVYGAPGVFEAAMAIPNQRLVLNDRLILVAEFALGLLAGLGVTTLAGHERPARVAGAVLALGAAAWLALGVAAPAVFAHSFFRLPGAAPGPAVVWQAGLWRAAGAILLGAAALAAAMGLRRRAPRPAAAARLLLPLLLFADLWQAHAGFAPALARAAYFPVTPAIRFLQQQPGLFRIVAASDLLPPETNLAYGLSDVRGYDGLEPQLYYQLVFQPALKQNTGASFHPSPLLDLLNVRYALVGPGDAPPARTAGGADWYVRVFDGGSGASVYENLRAAPRAWLAHQVEVEPDAAARPTRLADPAFDARQVALLAAPLPPAQPLPAAAPPAGADAVTVTTYAPEQVAISARSAAPGILVLGDMVYPGWQAQVDGGAAPIITVDHALRGLYLPAGRHEVRFDYRPASVAWGAVLSVLGLLLIALGFLWPRRRPRAAPAVGSEDA